MGHREGQQLPRLGVEGAPGGGRAGPGSQGLRPPARSRAGRGAAGAAPTLGIGHLPGGERDRVLAHKRGSGSGPSEGNQYQSHPGMAGQGCGDRNEARSDQARWEHHGDTAGAIAQVRPKSLSWKQVPLSGGWPSLRVLAFFITAFCKVSSHV